MELSYTPEEEVFRLEVRSFFHRTIDPGTRAALLAGRRLTKQQIVDWTRTLNAKGWAAYNWPMEYGGPGWTPVQRYIFLEELYRTPAPEPLNFNVSMIGPVIYTFGTDEQKSYFLPKIKNLDLWFCQGYSEPGAGSDLAALRTTARRQGNHYILNGQKSWTTHAHEADWMFCLVRTDPQAAKRQQGISFLILDMRTPGISVRPITSLIGHREVNEVFFDNVQAPVENLIHQEDHGWDVAKFLLSHERMGAGARVGVVKLMLQQLRDLAGRATLNGKPLSEDLAFRQRLAALEIEAKAAEMIVMRVLADAQRNPDATRPDPSSSITKILIVDLRQQITELMMQVAGPQAIPFQPSALEGASAQSMLGTEWAAPLAPNYFVTRAHSIFGGSAEIQRNIIARAFLGL